MRLATSSRRATSPSSGTSRRASSRWPTAEDGAPASRRRWASDTRRCTSAAWVIVPGARFVKKNFSATPPGHRFNDVGRRYVARTAPVGEVLVRPTEGWLELDAAPGRGDRWIDLTSRPAARFPGGWSDEARRVAWWTTPEALADQIAG